MRCSIYADFWQYSFNASLYSDEGLSITILSPPMHWIAEFDEWWMMEMTKAGIANDDLSNAMKQHHSEIEDFASDQIELVPSPIKINRFPIPPSYQGDESPANLASLVLMIERGGRRMLLPSDGRQDQILDALARAGYSDKEGNLWVNLLVLPHSGSKRNVSLEFFRRVKANNYFDLNEWCEIQASS